VYDFGARGIARGVQVESGRLVAVVGGDVVASFNPDLGALIQSDDGGYLYWVDLASGTATQLPDTGFRYRRPALSPDGRRVVAEVQGPGGPDLWMIELP
jgi:Tol biopolymer transport system component